MQQKKPIKYILILDQESDRRLKALAKDTNCARAVWMRLLISKAYDIYKSTGVNVVKEDKSVLAQPRKSLDGLAVSKAKKKKSKVQRIIVTTSSTPGEPEESDNPIVVTFSSDNSQEFKKILTPIKTDDFSDF